MFSLLRLGKATFSAHLKLSIHTGNCSMLLPTELGSHRFPQLLLCRLILPLCSPSRVVMAMSRHIDRCEWRIPYPIASKYRMDSMRYQYSTARLCPGLGHWEWCLLLTDWSTTSHQQQQQLKARKVYHSLPLWGSLFWCLINFDRLLYSIIFCPLHTQWIFMTWTLNHKDWS